MPVPLLVTVISLTVAAPAGALPPVHLDTSYFVYMDIGSEDPNDQLSPVSPPFVGLPATSQFTGRTTSGPAGQAQGQQAQRTGQQATTPAPSTGQQRVQRPSEIGDWIKPKQGPRGETYVLEQVSSSYQISVYWLPYFSLLSYMDAQGRIHVIPASADPWLRYPVLKAVRQRCPGITVVRLGLRNAGEMPDVVDFAAKLGYSRLITILAEYDPLALSAALALKWRLVEEYCREAGVDPATVGVVVTAVALTMARVRVENPADETVDRRYVTVLAPLLPNAAVIDVTDLDPRESAGPQFLDNFDRLLVGDREVDVVKVVVVYSSDLFRGYLERYFEWLLGNVPGFRREKIVFVRASADVIRGSFAVVLSPPQIPGGEGSPREREVVEHFFPWPATMFLAAVYGIPVLWMTRDVQPEGVRWEGLILIWAPKPSGGWYWDFETEFTLTLPSLLAEMTGQDTGRGGRAVSPTTLLSYATLIDHRGNAVQVGAPAYLFSLPCLGLYPWDLSAIDLNTAAVAFQDLGILVNYFHILRQEPGGGHELLLTALCGPYGIVAEADAAGTRIMTAISRLVRGLIDRARSSPELRSLLRDVQAVGVGLNLALTLIKGHYFGDVRRVVEAVTGGEVHFRFGAFFGLALSRGGTRTEPVVIDFDGIDERFRVIIGRGRAPRVTGPCLQAWVCDIYTVLEWSHSRGRRHVPGVVWWWVCALAWCCWRWWPRRCR